MDQSVAMSWANAGVVATSDVAPEAHEVIANLDEEAPVASPPGRLDGLPALFAFILAGNARFTLVSPKTGQRFTYRVRAAQQEGDRRFFVSVLTGADNESSYTYLGTVFPPKPGAERGDFGHGRKSTIGKGAPSAKAFAWFWSLIQAGANPPCEVWHCGKCGRCGRALTVPESIASGIGPECAKKVG